MKKRKDGRYQKSVVVGYADDGSLIRKIIYGHTAKEVTDKENEIRNLQKQGIRIDSKMTFAEASQLWLDAKKNARPKTYEEYIYALRHTTAISNVPVDKLRPIHLRKMVDSLPPATTNIVILTCKAVMKFLVNEQLLSSNPFAGVTYVKYDKKERRALTLDEQKLLLSQPTSQMKVLCMLQLLCGLRIGEASAITRADIDMKKRIININKQKDEYNNICPVKSKSSNRTVPVPQILIDEIRRMNTIAIVPQINRSKNACSRYMKNIGLPSDLTPHCFRHTYATNLYNSETDVRVAQAYLGHSSIRITMDIYTHLSEERKLKESEKYEAYLNLQFNEI